MSEHIALFVVGAHLSGMPLNRELTEVKGELRGGVTTAPDYRLFALPNTTPPKPGLLRAPGQGGAIAGEVWLLDPADFGRFVARIPAPLGIGKVTLSDGEQVSGFLCEAFAVEGARDVTHLGGWRAYIASLAK
jgi:allophanate hydrolase